MLGELQVSQAEENRKKTREKEKWFFEKLPKSPCWSASLQPPTPAECCALNSWVFSAVDLVWPSFPRREALPDLLDTPPAMEKINTKKWIKAHSRMTLQIELSFCWSQEAVKLLKFSGSLITFLLYSVLEDGKTVSTSLFLASYSLC